MAGFQRFSTNMTPAHNGDTYFSLPVFEGSAVICTVGAPVRRSWARRGPSTVPVAFVADEIEYRPTVMPIDDSSGPWLFRTSSCWPLEEHNFADIFAVSASLKTDDPLVWSGLLSPSTRVDAVGGNRGLFLNHHKDRHSFKHSRHFCLCERLFEA